MPRIRTIQTSFTSGELDPLLAEREDIKFYYSGAETMQNVRCLPQGGFTRRPGLKTLKKCRHILAAVSTAGATPTAPNGGTPANAIDGDSSTTVVTTAPIGTTDPYVVAQVDFGAETDVAVVDITDLSVTAGESDGEFRIQYSANGSDWSDFGPAWNIADDARSRRAWPATGVNARYWRLARIGATDLTTDVATLGELAFWTESASLSNARLIPFDFSTEQAYLFVAADRNIDVYKGGVWQVSIQIPHESADLSILNWTQSLDTLILFHPDHAPLKIFRQGAHDEWDVRAVVFSNIPQFDYGAGDEDIMSAARGWPRCGVFYQSRLFLGGLKGRPQTLLGSKIGDYYDLDTSLTDADYGLDVTADTDQVSAIYQLFAGRHLVLMTSGAEFYIPSEPITPTNIALKQTTRRGIAEGLRPVETDGAALFIQRGGNAVREFLFIDTEQSYAASDISILFSHLVVSPADIALRPANDWDEADLILMPLAAGTMTAITALRNHEVTAFASWITDGDFLAAASTLDGVGYVIVQRTKAGATERWLEEIDNDLLLDAAVSGGAGATLAGLDHLEGEDVHVIVDGSYEGTATVSSGSVTLPVAATESAQAGLNFTPEVTTMPVRGKVPDDTLMGVKKRIVRADISLLNTGGLTVAANGRAAREVPLRRLGDGLLDETIDYTGIATVQGFLGWSERGQLTIAQTDPAPMTVRALAMRVGV